MSSSKIFAFVLGSIIMPVLILWANPIMEQSSRSLTGNVITQTSLHPRGVAKTTDLSIIVDGQKLENPYLTSIQILNNGSKPLRPNEYESGIELKLKPDTKIVKAEVESSNPNDLEIKIATDKNILTIAPLLLNSAESFVITILTSGKAPEWQARARIAGIPKFQLNATKKNQPEYGKAAFLLAIIALLSYSIQIISDWMVAGETAKKMECRIVMGSLIFASSWLLIAFLRSIGDYEWWAGVVVFFFTFVLSGSIKWALDLSAKTKPKT